MNPSWILAGFVCSGLIFLVWTLVLAGAKEDKAMANTPVPVNNKGLSPYSAKPEDPDRSRVADKCFVSSSYCFWNDIFHYGGSKQLLYNSPELCMAFLHRDKHKTEYDAGKTYTVEEIREDLLKDYCFMAWYVDSTDRSVFALPVDTPEFLEQATKDQPCCSFLGFSWIDQTRTALWEDRLRIDPNDDGLVAQQLISSTDWRDKGAQLLEMDACSFEEAVWNYLNK